jgi:hypothetical protein
MGSFLFWVFACAEEEPHAKIAKDAKSAKRDSSLAFLANLAILA